MESKAIGRQYSGWKNWASLKVLDLKYMMKEIIEEYMKVKEII